MYEMITDAERRFNEAGTMFHLSTEPIEDEVVFSVDSDYITVINLIALAICCSHCKLLALAIMSNHLHLILEGTKEECLAFFEDLRNRLQKVFSRHGRGGLIARMKPNLVDIENLNQLRNEIAYVIRNPFVVRTDVNPFSFKWCSGYLYFNPMLKIEGAPVNDLKGRAWREFSHSRNEEMPHKSFFVKDGIAEMASFVDYMRVEQFFDNARQFVMWVLRNVEGQVEAALRHGEIPRLNDEELFGLSCKICRSIYRVNSPKELSYDNKKHLALKLKREYGASNGQVARCSNLLLSEVNKMFPLSVSKKP
ncbi:MAG: hypothetical protein K6F21_05240 [Bacteroidales bacterium]|nr:hypothetical protein [Bacteroidales bacterium]